MSAEASRALAPRRGTLKRYPPSRNGASADPPLQAVAPELPSPEQYGSGPRPAWLDVDWSIYEQQLQIAGHRVNFVDVGKGDPIVLVHGWAGRWQHWLDLLEPLARTRRVVALDMPGFGGSEMPAGGVTIPGVAETLLGLMDELEIDKAVLTGNSMGGAVAVETTLAAPRRVERLVLAAATGLADGYVGLPKAVLTNPLWVRWNELVLRETDLPKRSAARLAARPRLRRAALGWTIKYPERLSGAISVELIRGGGPAGAATAAASLASHDFRPRLGEISVPTLIIWGEDDHVVDASCAQRYAELIPHARLAIFEDTAHIPMIERPGRFLAELESFLDED
jgi:pimeloyl-ACP methyl ester carboxylesterase